MSKLKAASSRWPLPPRTTAVLLIIAFLIVVSSALATEGAMLRRNVSGTPDFETENAQITVAQFYIDAQRANGNLVMDEDVLLDENGAPLTDKDGELLPGTLEYYAETGDPEDETVLGRDFKTNEDLLLDERTIAKPIVISYYDEVEYDAYTNDGIPDNTQAAAPLSLGAQLANAVDDAFDAEALASGGVPDPEHRFDAFVSVSFDDGATWAKYNLSESALRSSFTLKDGTVYPGTVDYGVKHAMAGNKILAVWHSKYAMQGSPRYAQWVIDPASETGEFLLDADGNKIPWEYYGRDGQPKTYYEVLADPTCVVTFDLDQDGSIVPPSSTDIGEAVPLDIWGVAGSQGSIDYTEWMHHGLFPFAEVGEVPFSSIWTARGTIQQIALDEDDDGIVDIDPVTGEELKMWSVKWRKAERLTSGRRDAMYTAIDGAENAGFAIVWQEDPTGLRPGYGEGPGEGWSGSTAHHKTDLWYSYITWEDFDKVENPLFDIANLSDPDAVVDPLDLTTVPYFQTPEDVDALGWDINTFDDDTSTELGDLTTNKPQPYEKMSMPQRITDNNNIVCLIDGVEADLSGAATYADTGTLITPDHLSPVVGGSEDGPIKVNDLYAWLDLDDIDGDGLADGNGIPDMVAGGMVWENSQGVLICNGVTEDGRLLNGQQWSTRTRLMMEGYEKYILDENGETVDENADGIPDTERSAWLLMGYEDSKGLGPGSPDTNDDGVHDDLDAEIDPGDIGKVTKADTFEFTDPSFAKPGHMLNAPDLGNPGYEIDETVATTTNPLSTEIIATTIPPITGLIENDMFELQYGTPIARRPALFVNPILKLEPVDGEGNVISRDTVVDTDDNLGSIAGYKTSIKMKPGMTSAILLFKEGTMRQGGPADIMLRRWQVPATVVEDDGTERAWDAHIDNPFALENLVADVPDDYVGFTATPDDDPLTDDQVPIWRKDLETGEYIEPTEWVSVDSDGDGWDTQIVDGTLVTGETSRSAYPTAAFDDFTSEYYPNGVLVKGVQNVSAAVPLDVRELESTGGDTATASETIPAWHLDLMPDLAVKVEDGTLAFTDCYSCHPDSWGVKEDSLYPSHGILNRVWWWSQTDGSTEVNDEIMDLTEVNNYVDPITGETISGDTPILSITSDQLDAWGATQYDEHWKNPYELAKGHRGHIDGNDVMVMFGYAPNWLQSHYGKEPINLFIRRSFDGGRTWTTTPATTDNSLVGLPYEPVDPADADENGIIDEMQPYIDGGVSLDGVPYGSLYTDAEPNVYSQVQGTGSEELGRVFFYLEDYAAGDFERMRNVSQFYDSSSTIIDPRYSPTNNRRQTAILRKLSLDQTEEDATTTGAYNLLNGRFNFEPLTVTPDETLYSGFTAETGLVSPLADEVRASARTDDVRDPSKFFAVYESGDSGPMREGFEADAENLYYSRATQWGDIWEDVLWVPSGNSQNVDANTEPSMYWDWLENDAEDKSGEAAVTSSPGGQYFYATWNQWTIYEGDEHEHEFDAMFRRCYWVPDMLREIIFPLEDEEVIITPEEPVAAEGEVVTLTATVDDGELADRLYYIWDLDGDGTFETEGDTVSMVASGAMQHVTVIVKDKVGGGLTAEDAWVNGALNTPMVWNVKFANGNTGLAGTRVALRANFRSPGVRWNAPAPADYDFSVQSVIDWGDGSEPEAGVIASQNDGKGSKRFVTGEHKYGKPGLYTVKVTVTNAYGGIGWDYLQYAVIVHRKAGALAMAGTFEDPNGGGDASIAANVKYKLKGKFPSGKVLFTLGDKSFVSEKLDWMAVSGRKAWVRGQGQLNGVGGYDFLLAVADDRQNLSDLVRVKIWKANGKMAEVIYDSQPGSPDDALAITPMKTGTITIPLFKGKSWKYYLMQKK